MSIRPVQLVEFDLDVDDAIDQGRDRVTVMTVTADAMRNAYRELQELRELALELHHGEVISAKRHAREWFEKRAQRPDGEQELDARQARFPKKAF